MWIKFQKEFFRSVGKLLELKLLEVPLEENLKLCGELDYIVELDLIVKEYANNRTR